MNVRNRSKTHRWLALTLLAMLLSGCQVFGTRRQPPPSPIPLRDLLIDVASYPPGWKVENVVEDDSGNEIENLSVSFRNPTEDSPVSRHEIRRYASQYEAQQAFDLIVKHKRGYEPSLVAIPQFTYTSQTAQRTSLLCMKRNYEPVEVHRLCIAIAQYGPYISLFSAPINRRFMSYADFARILSVMDSKMASVANAYQ